MLFALVTSGYRLVFGLGILHGGFVLPLLFLLLLLLPSYIYKVRGQLNPSHRYILFGDQPPLNRGIVWVRHLHVLSLQTNIQNI